MNSTSGIKNHLANEKSPYLLQHLYNPVDWYPWSEDALNRARNENKPIFISIGYSTCHWCHVMAHESFEDAQVAGKLNRDFIAIKVDREERPDIDTAFMQACQMMNKHGGWPLNLFLTPAGKPFYAMTYAPKHTQGRAPGFIAIIDKIAEIWKEQPDQLISGGEQVATAIAQMEKEQTEESLQSALLGNAAQNFKQLYDATHAGFGSAPKFPQPHNSALLFRLHQRFNDAELSSMALTTLDHIKQGGITDQLGGGLHRYSVDERWLVPHFEKMLYDQALITESYLDAWQVSGDSRFQLAAEKVLNYVLRELQNREGGFFCGEDADSEGAEGTYYLWTPEELQKHLSNEEYQLYASVYCITPEGNFEGGSILHRSSSMADLAQSQNSSERDLNRSLEAIHAKLLGIRNQRPHPHLDDKILAGWNGLMVAAMARAGALYQRDDYLQAAHMAVEFICRELYREGTLLRRYRHGVGEIDAFHEDYAYLIHGLIELFHADPKADILELALTLNETCNQLFRDEQGHYYDSAVEFIDGIGRGRSKQDGAIPAPASVTARNLVRLSRLTGRPAIEEAAQTILSGHLTHADRYPTAFAYLLMALDLYLTQPCSLVVVADEKTLPESWHSILCQFRPSLQILVVDSNNELADLVPQAAGKGQVDATITAWFCSGDSCLPPVNQPAELEKLLNDYIPLKTFIK